MIELLALALIHQNPTETTKGTQIRYTFLRLCMPCLHMIHLSALWCKNTNTSYMSISSYPPECCASNQGKVGIKSIHLHQVTTYSTCVFALDPHNSASSVSFAQYWHFFLWIYTNTDLIQVFLTHGWCRFKCYFKYLVQMCDRPAAEEFQTQMNEAKWFLFIEQNYDHHHNVQ